MSTFVEVAKKSWHTSHFNIKTGRVTMDPATKDVATYRVRLVGDAVEVDIWDPVS